MKESLKESSAVHTHLNILQGIISRMAGNSSNCKTWAVTIVSAVLVLLIDKGKMDYYYISFIPLIMFFVLDAFYLGLEREFREQYKVFVEALNSETFDQKNVFVIVLDNGFLHKIWRTLKSLYSFSTTPFYFILGMLIYFSSRIG